MSKHDSVLTGKDSLFQTFRRAIANFKSDYQIPRPPRPPKKFEVTSQADNISLSWELYDESDPAVRGFRIYRSVTRSDGEYTLVREAGPSERAYADTGVTRGFANYYLFRLFDVAKPGPVRWADRLFKHARGWRQGWGILFDDLVAALCALLLIALWRFVWP